MPAAVLCKRGFNAKEKHTENNACLGAVVFLSYSTYIDECKVNPHGCHSDATCRNMKGSYSCTCTPGFQGDGKNSCDGDYQSLSWRLRLLIIEKRFQQYNEMTVKAPSLEQFFGGVYIVS